MRSRLRNNIYVGVFPMLILMLGLIAYIVVVTRNANQTIQGVSSDQYEALSLLSNLQRHLLVIEQRAESGKSFESSVDNLRRDLQTLTAVSLHSETLDELLKPLLERMEVMAYGMGEFDDKGRLPAEGLESLRSKLDNRMFALTQMQTDLSSRITNTSQYYQKIARKTYIILGSGMTLAVFIALFISRKLSSDILTPIEELNEAIHKISQGDMDVKFHLNRRDEIGDFSRAFASMVSQLRDYQELTNRKLLRSTNALRMILEKTPDVMFVVRQDLSRTFSNPRAEEFFAAPEFKEEYPDELKKIIVKTFDERTEYFGQNLEDAISFRVKGEEHYFRVHTFPFEVFSPDLPDFKSEEEDVIAVAVILQDVTMMQLSDRLKSNLVATVSHELKTPLTSARMSLYLLAEQQIGTLNEDQMEMVKTAKDDLNRQLATIQNLLDLSRIENDKKEITRELFSLDTVLTASFKAHETLAEGAHVELKLDVPDESIEVIGDAYRIQVVVNNFVSNAIKYSGEGAHVILRCFAENEKVFVEVEDDGPGIESDRVEILFNPYQRGVENSSLIAGSGLGLSIAKDVIEAHGGNLGCRSEIDRGSCFFFELPYATGGA